VISMGACSTCSGRSTLTAQCRGWIRSSRWMFTSRAARASRSAALRHPQATGQNRPDDHRQEIRLSLDHPAPGPGGRRDSERRSTREARHGSGSPENCGARVRATRSIHHRVPGRPGFGAESGAARRAPASAAPPQTRPLRPRSTSRPKWTRPVLRAVKREIPQAVSRCPLCRRSEPPSGQGQPAAGVPLPGRKTRRFASITSRTSAAWTTPGSGEALRVVYHLFSISLRHRINLKSSLPIRSRPRAS
jgi:hypothetical protein